MGDIYYKMGKKKYAVMCFENALKINPDKVLQKWLRKYKNKK